MLSTESNGVKQYNLSVGKSVPEWLESRRRRRSSPMYKEGNLQLLQDLDMPGVSDSIVLSQDNNFLLATGVYKPRIKCFDCHQLGLKFERGLDSEVTSLHMLSSDYSKVAMLQADRHVELHSQSGRYYRVRLPRVGRDCVYEKRTCDLMCVGDSAFVYRLNLEQGRFLAPLESCSPGLNASLVNEEHQLLCLAGTNGSVEAWDTRCRSRVGILAVSIAEITALAFRDALNMAVGDASGIVRLYDLRSSKPLLNKDHKYGLPIKRVSFHRTMDQVVSMDARALKIWDRRSGDPYTSIESEHVLNDFALYDDKGLLFLANEQPRMQVHFIPSLGPAPNWCAFLDNLTEELEETKVTDLYDDYKFVTVEQLQELDLEHLIGTNLLRAHMHGYFIDVRLYNKAAALIKPFSAETLMKERVESRLASQTANRIGKKRDALPKVNRNLYLRLREQEMRNKDEDDEEDHEVKSKKKKKKSDSSTILQDDRFNALFTDENFHVDEQDEAYKLINPVVMKSIG